MQNAVANVMMAVELMVCSAFRWMEAKACRELRSIPARIEIRIAISRTSHEGMAALAERMNMMPANAPKTMMPSSAMFRTPLRSENRSPRPTRSSGTRKISVCWQIKINRFIYFSAPFPVWCTSVLWRSCHLRMPSRMMKENALK